LLTTKLEDRRCRNMLGIGGCRKKMTSHCQWQFSE